MITRISKKITEAFLKNNIINEKDKDLYTYGLEYIVSAVLPISISIVISALFDLSGTVLLYTLTFIVFRVFAGGYHASSHLKCQILFLVILAVCTFTFKIMAGLETSILQIITITLAIIASCIIIRLAPVDNANKPFCREEFISFRKKTRILNSFVLLSLIIVINFTNDIIIFFGISFAMLTVAISLIVAKKGRRENEEVSMVD